MRADRKIQSAATASAVASGAAASPPPAAKRKRMQKRASPFDPRQSNLLLPIRGEGRPAEAAEPASAPPPADAGTLSPVDTLSYRNGLGDALAGEDDAQIAEWARGDRRAAKNWRLKINGADAPSLLNLAQPGRSARVRAWLLETIGAAEPAATGRKAS